MQVTLLVAGSGCGGAAKAAAAISGVDRVIVSDNASLAGGLAENVTLLLLAIQEKHSACQCLKRSAAIHVRLTLFFFPLCVLRRIFCHYGYRK